MTFKAYSTESGKVEEFEPNIPGHATMYICGPTVYDLIHIGHARSYVFFDLLRRWLEYRGYEVTHVQNFSDVEQSITKRAKRTGSTPESVARMYIEEFFVDAESLNLKKAHSYPTYSENVPQMIRVVQDLVDSGMAYESDGDVYFKSEEGSGFGRLSHTDPRNVVVNGLEKSGGREHPFDFILWRRKREGEPTWDSPWGKGRPGWHIGCYVMSSGYLGRCFDIHGGGLDLVFPHHESIMLVSEAHTKKPVCNYFFHNGFVTLGKEKMSKSKGNFVTVRELSDKYGGEAIRYYILKHHYRTILDYDETEIRKASEELKDIKRKLDSLKKKRDGTTSMEDVSGKMEDQISRFDNAMDNDLRTEEALSALIELIDWAGTNAEQLSREDVEKVMSVILQLSDVLGILKDFSFQ